MQSEKRLWVWEHHAPAPNTRTFRWGRKTVSQEELESEYVRNLP